MYEIINTHFALIIKYRIIGNNINYTFCFAAQMYGMYTTEGSIQKAASYRNRLL